jgi:DNA-binding response OmpR family regulator
LLVEDDPDTRYVVSFMLKEAGYTVHELSTGEAILDGLTEWPDLFLLDIDLPKINGFSLCYYIRSKKETCEIPIILMSAFRTARKKVERLGVNDFIQKPFALKEFLQSVGNQLQDR